MPSVNAGQYRFGVGRVARVLLLHVTPVLQGARVDIALQKGRSQDFAEPSLAGTLPTVPSETGDPGRRPAPAQKKRSCWLCA